MDIFSEEKLKCKTSNGVLSITALGFAKMERGKTGAAEQTGQNVILQFGSETETMSVNRELLKDRIPYFNGMFSNCFQESNQAAINLGISVDQNSASKLIQFISKGSLKVSGVDIQGLFVLADLWGMDGIKIVCESFMISEMDSSNCLELLQLGEMHSCDRLIMNCRQLICQEFQIVCQSQSFLDLSSSVLISILQFEHLNTGAQREDCVMQAVARWYNHDKVNRETFLAEVLKHVHINEVSQNILNTFIPCLPATMITGMQSNQEAGAVPNARPYKQRFMVCCGYSQSRTGPTCPRCNSTELFDSQTGEFHRATLLEAPSYGVAFNLFGRIVYIAVYLQMAGSSSGKKSCCSTVFIYRPCANGGEWTVTPDLFSPQAMECITGCLMKEGSVVHCPENNLIYAIEIGKSVCIQADCTGGNVFCDYKDDLPSLLPHLDSTHAGLQGVCHQGLLYVLGGFYGPQLERMFSDVVLALSVDGSKWEPRQPMIIPRVGFAIVSFRKRLLISGGYGVKSHRRRHQTCESYDITEDRWEQMPPMQQSRSGHCMVVVNDCLYVLGGKSYASQKLVDEGGWHPGGARIVSDFVELYEESSKEWLRIARMHNARCNFCTVVM